MGWFHEVLSGRIVLWKLIVLYDLLVRIVVAVPMILLKEAPYENLMIGLARLTVPIVFLVYSMTVLIGVIRSLRSGVNGTAMIAIGWFYVLFRGIELLSAFGMLMGMKP